MNSTDGNAIKINNAKLIVNSLTLTNSTYNKSSLINYKEANINIDSLTVDRFSSINSTLMINNDGNTNTTLNFKTILLVSFN